MSAKYRKPRRLSGDVMRRELSEVISMCFLLMYQYEIEHALPIDFKEASNRTGLSLSTIYRLHAKRFRDLRCSTLQRMGAGAGLRITVVGGEIRLALAEEPSGTSR